MPEGQLSFNIEAKLNEMAAFDEFLNRGIIDDGFEPNPFEDYYDLALEDDDGLELSLELVA